MKPLDLPVPGTVTARYLIPLRTAMTGAQPRQRTIEAIEAQLTGMRQARVLDWVRRGAVTIDVAAVPDGSRLLPEPVGTVRAIAQVWATGPASLVAPHEWRARGVAAALAASLDTPLFDAQSVQALDARDVLAALPSVDLVDPCSDDLSVRFSIESWVRFEAFAQEGTYWATSLGMRRFGLPEFTVGGCERDLRDELKGILAAVTFRVWSDLITKAQRRPARKGLLRMPRSIQVPAELQIHRKDLDEARGVPTQGRGGWATIGLEHAPAPVGQDWVFLCPPSHYSWWPDKGMEDFVADVCHLMFGFEKSRFHYYPGLAAVMEAMDSVPEARRRFNSGELIPGSQLMVRYLAPDDEPRWAQVESWPEDDLAVAHDIGAELAPSVTAVQEAIPTQARRIVDWAIWKDGEGVIEGARTETVTGP